MSREIHFVGSQAQTHLQTGLRLLPAEAQIGADRLTLHLKGRYTRDGRLVAAAVQEGLIRRVSAPR